MWFCDLSGQDHNFEILLPPTCTPKPVFLRQLLSQYVFSLYKCFLLEFRKMLLCEVSGNLILKVSDFILLRESINNIDR